MNNRKKAEDYVISAFKVLDPSGENSEHYKKKFKNMNDKQFKDFFENEFLKLYIKGFDNIPMGQIKKFLDFIKVPMFERVNLNYKYKDENGNAVQSLPCYVGYLHIPKLRQMNIKKSENGTDVSKMNPKTGEFSSDSKVVSVTDREFESGAVFGLHNTMREFLTMRSDDIQAFNSANSAIYNKGTVSMENDLPEEVNNISRKNLHVQLVTAQLDSNLMDF